MEDQNHLGTTLVILMIHAIGRAYFWHNLLIYFWVGVGEVQ